MKMGKTNEMQEMKKVIRAMLEQRLPLFLKGGVGIGKTELIREIAGDMGREVIVMHIARNSNTDFLIPTIEGGVMKFAINENLKRLEGGNQVLFLDEYDRATGDTRNAILSLINERHFDGLKLPDSVSIVLAGNQDLSRDTNTLNQAEITRFAVIEITAKGEYVDYWLQIANEKLKLDGRVITFIMNNKDFLATQSPDLPEDEAFATPRGWANVSKAMPIMDNIQGEGNRVLRDKLVSGFVGHEASSRFLSYLDVYSKLPSAEELLKNYSKYEINSPDKKLAVCDIFISYLKNEGKEENIKQALTIVNEKMGKEILYNFFMLSLGDKKLVKGILNVVKKEKATALGIATLDIAYIIADNGE